MIKQYRLSIDGGKKLSEHFKVKEFACKDGSEIIMIDENLVNILEAVRSHLGKPINIICGYRTEEYNKRCGGAEHSFHLEGKAADIRCEGISLTMIAILSAMYGARGIGIYEDKNFVHIDTRPALIVFRDK